MIGAAFGLGFVIGPAIGGLLGRSDLRMPGFFAAALTFANLIFAAMRLPESHEPEPDARIDASVIVAPIRDLRASFSSIICRGCSPSRSSPPSRSQHSRPPLRS